MENEKTQLSLQSYENFKRDLQHLKDIEKPRIQDEVKEARAQGDLSENADYDAAQERLSQVENRIKEIEKILKNFEIYGSKKDLQKLKEEQNLLSKLELPKVRDKIKEFSNGTNNGNENIDTTEWLKKEKQIDGRLSELELIIKNFQILQDRESVVRYGAQVEIEDVDSANGVSHIVKIVFDAEATPLDNKISYNSPLGAALMGKSVGDIVTVKVPKRYDVRIKKISW